MDRNQQTRPNKQTGEQTTWVWLTYFLFSSWWFSLMWGSGIEVGSLSQVLFQDCLVCLLAFVMLMHSNCLVCWFCHARALKLSCFMHSANLLLGVGTLLDSSSAFLFCFGFKICSFNITCSSVYLYKSWLLVKNLSLWYHLAECSGRVMEESWWERRMWNKFRFVCFCEIFSLKIFMILWQGWYKKRLWRENG